MTTAAPTVHSGPALLTNEQQLSPRRDALIRIPDVWDASLNDVCILGAAPQCCSLAANFDIVANQPILVADSYVPLAWPILS